MLPFKEKFQTKYIDSFDYVVCSTFCSNQFSDISYGFRDNTHTNQQKNSLCIANVAFELLCFW